MGSYSYSRQQWKGHKETFWREDGNSLFVRNTFLVSPGLFMNSLNGLGWENFSQARRRYVSPRAHPTAWGEAVTRDRMIWAHIPPLPKVFGAHLLKTGPPSRLEAATATC